MVRGAHRRLRHSRGRTAAVAPPCLGSALYRTTCQRGTVARSARIIIDAFPETASALTPLRSTPAPV